MDGKFLKDSRMEVSYEITKGFIAWKQTGSSMLSILISID